MGADFNNFDSISNLMLYKNKKILFNDQRRLIFEIIRVFCKRLKL